MRTLKPKLEFKHIRPFSMNTHVPVYSGQEPSQSGIVPSLACKTLVPWGAHLALAVSVS